MSDHSDNPRPVSAKRAGAVTIVGQLVKALVQLVGLIAFSHLLSPRDIGIFTMLVVVLSLGELLRDFGLSQASIQTAVLTQRQASNLFWSNVLIGVVMACTLYTAAPALADLYGEPALRTVAPWVALAFIINALQAQFQVRLTRDLRFVALTATDASAQVMGLVAGLIAAVEGLGYWSLVIQMLVIYASVLAQRAVIADWWPGRPRRTDGMVALYRFGLHSGLAQLTNYVAFNADSYVVGTRWGASALGIYNRAFQMFTVPASQLLAPLTNVVLPYLSKRHHDSDSFYPFLLKVQVFISVVLTGLFSIAASLAAPIVITALGQQWRESAPLLSILSIGGAIQVLSYVTFWAYLASDNTRPLLFSALVTRSILVLCIIGGSTMGLTGVACGVTAGLTAAWFINLAWLKRCNHMPISSFAKSGLHVLLCGAVAGGMGWYLVTHLVHASPLGSMLVGVPAVTAIYISLIMSSRSVRTLFRDAVDPIVARLGGPYPRYSRSHCGPSSEHVQDGNQAQPVFTDSRIQQVTDDESATIPRHQSRQ
ncbi:lipopolysaccharide biosynthesis protein [Mycolicibacterium mucogenicum]|uniref:Lipopolysaccharide biosynthesis protein n=1 Tax=Mycolicibacterium mucogenicum DSM 44124 TaxID=1226753 RepID=A0A8H2J8T4_MYCMU|nr:lipopolysaccharide biosynthesis protein [Mycolicibacterium mucogenicum]KAB7751691.1 hypothetical protein MMUC44124_29205 [Mycolicibacterium mucogenicum DSM 44124]QPG69700.1 lipopolysaccharide biosynthesis protein [Mycolicibacterium mucogenicum DSM 44124]